VNKDIKLIALDLDGTLVKFHDGVVPERTVKAIKEAQDKGIEVVIATGRHLSSSLAIAEQLNIHYIITLNGGEIWTSSGELLKRQAIDRETVEKIFDVHNQYQTHHWLVSHERVYNNELPENHLDYQWIKFGFEVEDDEMREAMKEKFTEMGSIELSNSSLSNMELNAIGVHKAGAIQLLLDKLNLSFDQVMAIGDSINDIKMIDSAGLGVAMGNAQAPVKKKADWITKSNQEDGVAVAIEELILK